MGMMAHLQQVFWILLPLFVGFAIKLPKHYLIVLDRFLSILVWLILLLMGMALAQVDGLGQAVGQMAMSVAVLFTLLMACNLLVLMWFDRRFFRLHPFTPTQNGRQKLNWLDSVKQIFILIIGIIIGKWLPESLPFSPHQAGQYALMSLILVVGLQMRGQGMALRQVVLNRHGLMLSVWFILSCLLAGLLFAAWQPEVSVVQGLALASGYGWYSLSGIMMTQLYGATWGAVALLNDLLRELVAFSTISILMQRYPSTAIGIGGATSLDFTLPIIQKSGGLAAVPVAIAFGFIVNVLAPFLMAGLGALGR